MHAAVDGEQLLHVPDHQPEHLGRDTRQDAVFLGDGDEYVRPHLLAAGTLPAHQRLGAHAAARTQVDDGLVMHRQLAPADRGGQLARQRQTPARQPAHQADHDQRGHAAHRQPEIAFAPQGTQGLAGGFEQDHGNVVTARDGGQVVLFHVELAAVERLRHQHEVGMVVAAQHARARQHQRHLHAIGRRQLGEPAGLDQRAVVAVAHRHHAQARTHHRHGVQPQRGAVLQVQMRRLKPRLIVRYAPAGAAHVAVRDVGQLIDGTFLQRQGLHHPHVLRRTGIDPHGVQPVQHFHRLVQHALRVLEDALRLIVQALLLQRHRARPRHLQREADRQEGARCGSNTAIPITYLRGIGAGL